MRRQAALEMFQKVTEKRKMLGIAAYGYTLARLGRRPEALRVAAELERDAKTTYIPAQEIAFIYIGLDEKDKAFKFLDDSFNERYGSLSAIKVEPLFDPIRDDFRFADLLRKMSLAGS